MNEMTAEKFADFLNKSIEDMVFYRRGSSNVYDDNDRILYEKPTGKLPKFTVKQPVIPVNISDDDFGEYNGNRLAIEDLFDNPTTKNSLSKMLIYQRLALIDSFYGTNVNRMRQFGLEELTDAIWNECFDKSKNRYADAVLVNKAVAFVQNPSNKCPIFANLFAKDYGYIIDGKGIKRENAESLISKYLFFLVNASGDKVGFPIYDSIVRDLSKTIGKKLNLSNIGNQNICELTRLLNSILNILKVRNPSLWNEIPNLFKSQYDMLDFFLWRIGKVGRFRFSLLITKSDLSNYSYHFIRLKWLETLNNANGDKDLWMRYELQFLPVRFRYWYDIYTKIKK